MTLFPSMLGAWLHDIDPFAVRISGGFGIRWYGLAYVAGFVIAVLLLRWMSKIGMILIPRDRVIDALLWLVAGVLVGGRVGYVLVYDRPLLWSFSSSPPWWGLLALNEGGMASHGGMIGVILASWRISRGWKEPDGTIRGRCTPRHVMDTVAAVAAPGLFFGRIANFVNGELLGRVVTPPGREGPWWSVQFPQELSGWVAPGVRATASHAPDLTLEQRDELRRLVSEAAPGLGWREGIDVLIARAGDHADRLKPLLSSRHPSQLYQAVAEGLIVGAIVWLFWAKPRRPGLVGSVWLLSYGVLRIVTEFWRLPDEQFADGRPWGLSRGQWLSVAMVVVGGAACVILTRRGGRGAGERLGGWLRPRRPGAVGSGG